MIYRDSINECHKEARWERRESDDHHQKCLERVLGLDEPLPCIFEIGARRSRNLLRMRVPVPKEVQPLRKMVVNVSLLPPSIWREKETGSLVFSIRPCRDLDDNCFSGEAGKELTAGLARKAPTLAIVVKMTKHFAGKDQTAARTSDAVGQFFGGRLHSGHCGLAGHGRVIVRLRMAWSPP